MLPQNNEEKEKPMVIEVPTRVIIAFVFFVFGYCYCLVIMSEPIR
jgi:hypothetical protein